MKNIYLVAVIGTCLMSGLAFAECTDTLEDAMAKFGVGEYTAKDVASVNLCQLEQGGAGKFLCQSRIGIAKDLLALTESQAKTGLSTADEVKAARAKLAKTSKDCK